MRKLSKSKKHAVFDTLKQAAEYYNLTVPQLKWCKSEGAPGFVHSRIHEAEFTPWLDAHRDEIPPDNSRVEAEIRAETLRKLKIANDEADGLLVSKPKLAERLSALGSEIDGVLQRKLVTDWPAAAQGMPADEMSKLGAEVKNQIVRKFKEFAAQWT